MNKKFDFNSINLFSWITAFCIFEIPLALFFIYSTGKNSIVKKWYYGKVFNMWNVVIQDFSYALCGIIIANTIFNLIEKKINNINKDILFGIILILTQISGDLIFSLIIKNINFKNSNFINFFKYYIKKSHIKALIGDTIWITSWYLTFLFVSAYIKSFELKSFIILSFIFLLSAYSV